MYTANAARGQAPACDTLGRDAQASLAAHSHDDLPHRGLHGGGAAASTWTSWWPPTDPNVMAGEFPDSLLTLPFADPAAAVARCASYAARRPVDAVVPVDDATAVVGAAIAGALGLRANPVAAVARDARQAAACASCWRGRGCPRPRFTSFPVDDDPRGGGAARALPLRAQAARALGEPRRDPRRRRGGLRRRVRGASPPSWPRPTSRSWARAPAASSSRTSCRASRSRSRACSWTARSRRWRSSTSPIRSTGRSSRRRST